MVTKKIKELRDQLRSESASPEIARLKSEISQEAKRERAEVAALPKPPPSFRHREFDPRVVEQEKRRSEAEREKTPEQVEREQAGEAEVRREAFQEATGAGVLAEELEQQILEPPRLEPLTSEEAAIQQQEFFDSLAEGSATKEDIRKQQRLGAIGVALAGGVVAIPLSAGAGIGAAMTAKMGAGFGGFAKLAGGVIAVGGVIDFKGGEMNTMRKTVQGVVEDGEKIEAAVKNGVDPQTGIKVLTNMAEEVELAESTVKMLGNTNIQYLVSKEYLDDMNNIRTARIAILRRVTAIENIAATGQSVLNPDELLYIVGEIQEEYE